MSVGSTRLCIVAATLALCACGTSVRDRCLEVCEEAEGCADVDAECSSNCEEAGDAAEEIGCESEALDFYDCADVAGVCDADLATECETEINALFACTIDYCLDNPTSDYCQTDG